MNWAELLRSVLPAAEIDWVHYLISTAIGALVVLVFAHKTFNQPTTVPDPSLFETTLPSRTLGSKERLGIAWALYVAGMEIFFLLLCLVGPEAAKSVKTPLSTEGVAIPIFIALLMTGLFPHVSWLQKIEIGIRTWAHEWALIPEAVREMANQISRAGLVPSEEDIAELALSGILPEHFLEKHNSINNLWARVRYTTGKLEEISTQRSSEMGDSTRNIRKNAIDNTFLRTHKNELKHIISDRNQAERDVRSLGRHAGSDDFVERQRKVRTELSLLMSRISIFTSCAVRDNKSTDDEVVDALREIGFKIDALPPESGFFDRHFYTLGIVGGFVFIVTLIGNFLLERQGESSAITGALDWAIAALLLHGSAAFVASRYRDRKLNSGKWSASPSNMMAAAAFAALVSGIVITFYALIRYSFPPYALLTAVLPWGILGGVTALFVTYFLSHPTVRFSRSAAFRDAVLQGAGTAAAVWVLMNVLVIVDVTRPLTPFEEAFRCLVGFGIGCIIGWLIPSEHRRADPYDYDRYARTRYLDMLARATKHFGDDSKRARDWLFTRIPEKNMSPFEAAKTASASAEIFDVLRQWETPPLERNSQAGGEVVRPIAEAAAVGRSEG